MDNMAPEVEALRSSVYHGEDETRYEIVGHERQNNVQEKGTVWLFVSVAAANLLSLGTGCHIVWTSPTIPRLVSNDTLVNPLGDSPATVSDISLIAGSYFVGSLVGNLIPARVLDNYGRKPIMAVVAALLSTASIVLAFAGTVWLYCVCRFVLGIGNGATFMLIPIYVGEIAHKGNRGRFSYFLPMFLALGFIYSYVTGPPFSTRVYTLLCAVPNIMALVCILLVAPETPYFLASKNKPTLEIANILRKLRSSDDLRDEIKQIESAVSRKFKMGCHQKTTYMCLFRDRTTRKAFMINSWMMIFHIMSGITVIHSFLGPILDTVITKYWDGNTLAIAISLVKLFSTLLGSIAVERYGRKPLLIWTAITVAFSYFLLGLYFQLQALHYEVVSHLYLLPFICLVLFSIAYSFGLGPLPFTYLSEFFPQHAKNAGVPVCTTIGTLFTALVVLVFPYFMEYLGMQWVFWMFTVSCISCAIFTKYLVPETKGKTLEEIQRIMEG